MKTKIFLPVVAMLSLTLFSFTTTRNAEGSVRQLANGNYKLVNVQLQDEDLFRIDQLTERISISGELNEDTAALGIWIYRKKKKDENKFTETTAVGTSMMQYLSDGDIQQLDRARREIDGMMTRYMYQ